MYLYNHTDSTKSNEIDFLFKPASVEENNFEPPEPGILKRNKADVRASNNQEEESNSSSMHLFQ